MANEKPGILNVRDTLQKQGKTSEEIKGALTTLFSAKDAKLAMESLPTPAPIAVPIVPPVPVTLDTIAPIVPPVPVSPTAISIEKETAKHQAKLERGQRVEENRKKEAAIKTGTLTKSPEAVENEKQVKLFNESLEKTNKKLKELNKDIEKTDKNFKDLGKTLEKRGTTKEGIEHALGVTQKTKELGSIGANVKDFFSVRGFLDKTGIVKRGSGGIFDTALAGREHKIETLKTERQMGLDVDAEGNKLSKKEHVARYGKIQKEGRELSAAKAEKERILESTKMTEEGFAKTGVGEKLNAKIESRETMMRTLHPGLAMHHEKEEAEKLKLEEKKKPKTKQKKSNVLNVVIDEEESPGKQKKSRVKAIPKQAVEPLQPALVSKNSAAAIEAADDQTKLFEEQNKLLKEIRDNTTPIGNTPKGSPKVKIDEEGGGFFGDMMKNLGKAFSSMFSPMNIIKMLGKIAFVSYIVTAVVKGFMDGWDEFLKSGDVMTALITGLEGFFEVLTLGLVPKDSLTKVGEWIGGKMFEVVDNISKFISGIFDKIADGVNDLMKDFMNMISKIGLPRIEFDVPVIGKVGVGPFYPFKSEATNAKNTTRQIDSNVSASASPLATAPITNADLIAPSKVSQIRPQTADAISNISEQNAAARDNASKGSAGGEGMTVVNAPTTNNKTSIVQMKRPERTTERSSNTVLSLTQGRNTVYL